MVSYCFVCIEGNIELIRTILEESIAVVTLFKDRSKGELSCLKTLLYRVSPANKKYLQSPKTTNLKINCWHLGKKNWTTLQWKVRLIYNYFSSNWDLVLRLIVSLLNVWHWMGVDSQNNSVMHFDESQMKFRSIDKTFVWQNINLKTILVGSS